MSYDAVIIGTPVWNRNISAPTRTYIHQNADCLKQVAFFCIGDGGRAEKVLHEMAALCEKQPIGSLNVRTEDVVSEKCNQEVRRFVDQIRAKLITFLDYGSESGRHAHQQSLANEWAMILETNSALLRGKSPRE